MTQKILVVDDEQDILEIVRATLKTKGYEIDVAHDGKEGLAKIKSGNPDLVILDLMMPGMSGLEICKLLKKDPATENIPVIILSAIGKQSGKGEEFWKSGLKVDDFIQKPFDPLDLLGRVEYVFRQHEYVSHQSNMVRAPDTERTRTRSLEGANPEEVVKTFIEAWNTQDFSSEYECLASEMLGNIVKKDYITRRKQCYLDSKGEQVAQKCIELHKPEIHHNMCKVSCLREDTIRGHAVKKEEDYVLRKIDKSWKIVNVRQKPLTKH